MTAKPEISQFVDAQGVEIVYYSWTIANPRAVVQLVHGLGEHARRYDKLAAYLNAAGFAVYATDHRGHGETGLRQVQAGATKRLGNLGVGGMNAVYEGEHDFTRMIRANNKKLPLILMGQSWGSFISQKLVSRYSNDYDLLVLTGTTLPMPHTLGAFNFNKKWNGEGATGFEWLSRDPEVAKTFLSDPKCFYADAAKVMGVSNSLRIFGRPSRQIREALPILIMVGSDDPLGAERGAHALVEQYRKRANVQDIELVVYHEGRHEVLNEINQAEVYADLLEWLNSHLGA